MNRSRLAIAAAVSAFAFAAHAESPDVSGQFATVVDSGKTVAAVQAETAQARASGVNPWSISYNPLKSFTSQRTRAQVQAEYLDSRDRVQAFTGEDSGSAYLASHGSATAGNVVAGHPVNAQ